MKRAIIFSCAPQSECKFKDLFSIDGPAWGLARNPPFKRPYGWNLQTLDQGSIENGDHLVFRNGTRKTLELFEDGLLNFAASADKDFLGWADNHKEGGIRINSLPLIEVSYHYVELYSRLIPLLEPPPTAFTFFINGKNLKSEHESVYLVPAPIFGWGFTSQEDASFAPNGEFSMELKVTLDALGTPLDVGAVAFALASKIFVWFGFPVEKVPYSTKSPDGTVRIDPNLFEPKK